MLPVLLAYRFHSLLCNVSILAVQQLHSGHGVGYGTDPQNYLESLLQERGYSATTFRAMDTSFYSRPTEFQKASYGPALVQAVRSQDAALLRELLMHLSANPCTAHGESLWHMVCRRGNLELLQVLLEHESAPELCQSVNEYGRTVLHDACSATSPALQVTRALLDRNPILLFLEDRRGSLPLSYIPAHQWSAWVGFLGQHVDTWFPRTGATVAYQEAMEWVRQPPHSKPLIESERVSLEVTSRIASGHAHMILEWSTSDESNSSLNRIMQSTSTVDEVASDYDDNETQEGDQIRYASDSYDDDDDHEDGMNHGENEDGEHHDSNSATKDTPRNASDTHSRLGGTTSAWPMVYHHIQATRAV